MRRMRTIQMTIAATMLTVPASAFALSNTTSADASPSPVPRPMRVTPQQVTYGHPVTITGATTIARAGERVALQAASSVHANWRRLTTTRVGRRGRFAFHAHLRRSGVVRAVAVDAPASATSATPVAVTTPGGAALVEARNRALVARVAAVKVAAQMRVQTRAHDILAGQRIEVAGHLLPGRAGRSVALEARAGRNWRVLARARTGGRGGFAVRYRPTSGSDRRLRVVFAGDRVNAGSARAAGEMTLFEPTTASWYEDGGNTACGYHAGLGVANRTLPCGTKVRLRCGHRTVTATVDDRGPYVYGRDYDLNQTTAAALGFAGVGTVWASVE